jgi:hypothetical protein
MSEQTQTKTPENSNKIPLHKVLEEELDYLDLFPKKHPQKNVEIKDKKEVAAKQDSKQKGKQPENTTLEKDELSEIYKRIHIQASHRSALCLSGGGIRSATFSLGVIQGLAEHGLLGEFDYLSTVSGGGYIGSWLTAWIHRKGLNGVAEELKKNTNKSNLDSKPDPVKNLRSYSNYLTPKLGIMSSDIWTLAAIYLRNLFLNWLVFIPLLMTVLIIPRVCIATILTKPPNWLIYSPLIIGAIAVVLTIYYIGVNCPSNNESNKGPKSFRRWCLTPLIISAVSLTTYWAWYSKECNLSIWHFIGFGAMLHLIGWLAYSVRLRQFGNIKNILVVLIGASGGCIAWLMVIRFSPDINLFAGRYAYLVGPLFQGFFLITGILLVGLFNHLSKIEAMAVVITGASGGYITWLTATHFFPDINLLAGHYACLVGPSFQGFFLIAGVLLVGLFDHFSRKESFVVLLTGALGGFFAWLMTTYLFPAIRMSAGHYVCFAAPSFLGLFLIAGVLLVGFLGRYFEDKDLEWLARFGAWVLIAITIWSAGSSLVIFGPVGLLTLWEKAPTLIASLGGISGIVTLFFSSSSKTPFGRKQNENNGLISTLMNNVLIISASIFIVFLIALLSLGTDPIVRLVNNKLSTKIFQTKIIDKSDFWAGEFKSEAVIEKLCNIINDDLKYSLEFPIPSDNAKDSVNGLNELLKVANFYNIIQEKKPDKSFSEEISVLTDKTQNYSHKEYSDLSNDEKSNIKRLNRLLLEETYPQEIPKSRNPYSHLGLISNTPFRTVGVLFIGLVVIVIIIAKRIDINKFSLHSLYCNRLIRAYLGASNPNRKPNLFTGFDESDNINMNELCSPDFRADEFKSQSSVVELCNEIYALIIKESTSSSKTTSNIIKQLKFIIYTIKNLFPWLTKKPYSIEWLNECLRMPNLYEKLSDKPSIPKDSPIQKILKKTEKYRTKQFNDLNNIQQYNIKLLNRLLLEKVYSKITPNIRGKNKLFHIVNITLNLVKGDNLAWQERKAASFTISPLHSGSSGMHFDPDTTDNQPNSSNSNKSLKGCYRSTEVYGGKDGGISLGTAITVSGAAASPNMGYHSSSVLAFLMTLFNIRLGLWLGNPAKETYNKKGPTWAIQPVISDMFGLTNEKNPYIYLSDGGHFENLGLYEMVLRRCHYIVLVDASCDKGKKDKDYEYECLGNAIRKIRIDLGVEIELDNAGNNVEDYSIDNLIKSGKHCVIFNIKYPEIDESDVKKNVKRKKTNPKLIYIKPMLCGKEPADIVSYKKNNPKFPHESTGDQWFSESQFESYRKLGFHAIEEIIKEIVKDDKKNYTLSDFFKQAENYVNPPK